jgi:hypothetical protein
VQTKKILDSIIEYSLIGGALGGAAFLVFKLAQEYFGLFAYPSLTPSQINAVAKEYDEQFKIITRACDKTHCRGVYNTGGLPIYYNWQFGKSYDVYPLITEHYTTQKPIFGDQPPLVYPE